MTPVLNSTRHSCLCEPNGRTVRAFESGGARGRGAWPHSNKLHLLCKASCVIHFARLTVAQNSNSTTTVVPRLQAIQPQGAALGPATRRHGERLPGHRLERTPSRARQPLGQYSTVLILQLAGKKVVGSSEQRSAQFGLTRRRVRKPMPTVTGNLVGFLSGAESPRQGRHLG